MGQAAGLCASFDPFSSSLPRGLARTLAAVPCGQLATPPAASNVTSRRCRCCCCRRRRPVPQLASLSVSQGLGVSDRLLLLRPPFVLATGVSLRKLPSFRKRLAPTLLLSMLPPHPADLARAASASGRRTSALCPPVRLRPPPSLSAPWPQPPHPPSHVCGGSGAKGRCARGRVWATGRADNAQPTPNRSPPWAICLAATDLPSPSSLFFSPANDPLPQCLPPGGAVPPCQPSAGASAGRPRPVRQGQADVPVREARAAVRVKRLQAPRWTHSA